MSWPFKDINPHTISRWAAAGRWDFIQEAARIAQIPMMPGGQQMPEVAPNMKPASVQSQFVGMNAIPMSPQVTQLVIQPTSSSHGKGQMVVATNRTALKEFLEDLSQAAEQMATRLVGGYVPDAGQQQ